MTENNEKKQDSQEREGYICFDDSPEKLLEGFEYLSDGSKNNQNNDN